MNLKVSKKRKLVSSPSTPQHVRKEHRKSRLKEEGRPSGYTKLTYEIQEKVTGFIAGGMRLEDACMLSGLHRSTVWNWKERGAAGEPRYKEFANACDLAEIKSKALLVAEIRRDADWKAKKWLLMNRFPREFKDRYAHEVEGKDGGPILSQMSVNPFKVEVVMSGEPEPIFTTIDHTNGKSG